MSVKDRLKILINKLGLKIVDFSRKTGIPYRTLQNYLSGQRSPSTKNLQKIAAQLGANINWLLTGEGEMFKKDASININQQNINGKTQIGLMNGSINQSDNITDSDTIELANLLKLYAPPKFIDNLKKRLLKFKEESKL